MMKMIKYNWLLFALIAIVSCNKKMYLRNDLHANEQTEHFYWTKAKIDGKTFDKAAMYIPISINNLKKDVYAQFDLGSNTSILYEKNVRSIKEFNSLILDTLKDANTDDGKKIFAIHKANLAIGKIDLGKRDIYGFLNYGDSIMIDKNKSVDENAIGTIGSDVVQNKFLIINFPASTISITDSLNAKTERNFNFVSCKLVNNRIIIPIAVNGIIKYFLYDTGASLFPMSTSKSIWSEITDTQINDTLNVTNFGNPVKMLSANTKVTVKIAGRRFKKFKVYYERDNYFEKIYKQIECDGIIGNSFFFDKIICIDYQTKRFGISK